MAYLLGVGRVCVKTAGREAGRKCVIVKVIDKNYRLVTGPPELTGVRRRKCNIKHLEPLPYVLDIGEDASDEEVAKKLLEANILSEQDLVKKQVKP
ncbi:MAG: 50S ribosomal protein L14e [Thermoproteota archaeon]|nr:MAG: 50S ribosomal protein L14e [Candidatus Korarchaeota archaeon]RLG54513.1 MAG: 50S ribosomal protein L14e [Candidatus Korarchaeota archaeon]